MYLFQFHRIIEVFAAFCLAIIEAQYILTSIAGIGTQEVTLDPLFWQV